MKKTWKCFLLVLLVLSLAVSGGCRKSDPVDTLKQMLTYLKAGKTNKAETLMYNPEAFSIEEGNRIELKEAVRRHLSWEIVDAHLAEDGTYYEVEMYIHMVDVAEGFGQITDKYIDEMMTDAVNGISWEDDTLSEELVNDLNAMIESDDPPMKDFPVTAYVVPDGDGGWKVFITQDLVNAITGGSLEMLQHDGFSF
ncbi:MAG: hypothetical protein IJJ34_00830 [Clostridia bacterium]|nr:hypothetical protein [Clostridia bacterium]